jgi:type 1 glutamine amidotransferase
MIRKYWLVTFAPVFLLSAALTAASCNLIHGPTATTTVTQVRCNAQQASTSSRGSPSAINQCSRRLLVFSKTGGFRHASIKDGKIALQKLAAEHNFSVDFTEDAAAFTDANLAHYGAVVFLLTTHNILDDNQKAAFERYIRAGGGYVGVHSASDTEYAWSWYGGLVGAYFDRIHGHSKVLQATIHVIDRTHPSTVMLPALWVRTDEWYNFASNPRGRVNVLMTIDESTYKGGVMGADHPIAWFHEYDGGRAWYTALGHTSESYYEPLFLAHLWGGIMYAAGGGQRVIVMSHLVVEQAVELMSPMGSYERRILDYSGKSARKAHEFNGY